ncbi:TonB-dependent receptor [Niabella yanshanensis]|uniref:TonB-dependent receptor n=1 Tax=Niabella yanshanensis TaxID=577386 RepID=A0ABZ0WD63_9BACT|nr:TonB-dependent receptor [Niabella yanshanensis]WQD40577.1 TonB-dependent receptor [Niabella yanshanensis]
MQGKRLPAFLTLIMVICALTVFAQTREVTGTVTEDVSNLPVSGATVEVKGTNYATVTDSAGNYRLVVPEGSSTLVFSFVGYTNLELPVTGAVVNAVLTHTTGSMESVVVIGYGTARKKDLTGAVATVSAKDFQKGNITTPDQLIAGKVSGVAITSNGGRPGQGSTIRIRGGSSLNASNDPLIVIDGVPVDNGTISGAANPLSFINPNDIESFTVLKDASASAIYGSRANNGVIIITTKKGKAGRIRVSYSTNNSLSTLAKKLDVLTGDQVRDIVNEYGSALHKGQVGTANTDWQDVIYRPAFASDNNVTITGGIKQIPYRISLGYLNQDGLLRTDNLKRTSVGLALNPTFFNNHLKVDLNLKGSVQNTRFANDGAVGAAISFDPTQPVYMDDPTYGGYFQWTEADGTLVLNRANNPLGMLEQTFDKQKPMRSIGNLQLDYKFHFLPELRANVNLGYDASSNEGTKLIPANAATNFLDGGRFEQGKQSRFNSVFDFYLNYAKDIAKHRIDATVGHSYNNFRTKNYSFRALNASKDTIAGTTAPVYPFDIPENTLISYWGRLLYNYDSRYFLTASLRRDGSSRFAPENRWGWFPSVGLAWSVKNELFKNTADLSELKLRFGYGLTGQQDGIGNYDYLARYGVGGLSAAYQFDNTFYNAYGPFGYNYNLKWEELSSYNIALDFGFLRNRINGSIDFYVRESKDLLNAIPQAAGTNFSAYVLANVGTLRNSGVEFTLNTQPVATEKVSLDVNFNYTYNKNEITNLTVIPDDPTYPGIPTGGTQSNGNTQLHYVGYPRNTFYLYQQVYDTNGKPLEGVFVDRNGDGNITTDDKYLNHSAVGQHMFGLSSNLAVNKWSGGFVTRAVVGNYLYNNVFADRSTRTAITGAYTLGNGISNYFNTGFTQGTSISAMSDLWVENASFIRMDNIFVGYNFGSLTKYISSVRAIASVQNAFIITKYKGLDPEANNGIDNNIYPRPRIFTLGLNFDF